MPPMSNNSPILTLAQHVSDQRPQLRRDGKIIALPHYWQVPAATEKTAYETLLAHGASIDFEYFAFPWATIIDGVKASSYKAWEILLALEEARNAFPPSDMRRVSTAQHINAMAYIDLFKSAGITDIFWSHATHDTKIVKDIRLHPFPLFPAQAPVYKVGRILEAAKPYLANFIGAYNPEIYLTNVRSKIFDDIGKYEDCKIIKRERWHFDRAVYDEQIKNKVSEQKQLDLEEEMKEEYLDAIRKSWFTLCPSGSGPNSIRIFECLNLGSIPIIITKQLKLPGSLSLWEKAAIIVDDSETGYNKALDIARNMSIPKRRAMLKAGKAVAMQVGPQYFADYMINAMEAE